MSLEITKAPKATYAGEALSEYRPPVLFPEIGKYADPGQQREYVMQCIEGLRESGKLCLTDMLAQPSRIRNLCGRIIFGIDINPDNMREERASRDLDAGTMSAPIKVECIEGRAGSVTFKRAVVNDPRGAGNLLTSSNGNALSVGGQRRLVARVDEVIDYEATSAVMGLRDAWVCLSKYGEHCVRAKTERQRNSKWRYREVDEDGTPSIRRGEKKEEPKRGPGRPKKER